jgi:GNAT superfamily N-acetyltransferase
MSQLKNTIGRRCAKSQLSKRFLEPSDFDSVMSFRATILSQLGDPDHYRREADEEAFVFRHLDCRGCTIGLFDRRTLVAFGCLALAEHDDTALLRKASTISPDEVAWLSATMVHPSYRGVGLQKFLIEERILEGYRRGRRCFASMVSPANHFSWKNLTTSRMHVRAVTKVDEKHDRLILLGSMDHNIQFDPRSMVIVDAQNVGLQHLLLETSYVGVEPHGETAQIRYYKPLDRTLE